MAKKKKSRQQQSKPRHKNQKGNDKRQQNNKFKANNAKDKFQIKSAKNNPKFNRKNSTDNTNDKEEFFDKARQKNRPTDKRKFKPRYVNKKKEADDGSDFEEIGRDLTMHVKADSFPTREFDSDTEAQDTRKLVQQQNRKKKKSGGFQSMGLSHPVYNGVIRKGYKIPTPIQRKTIPLIMDGKDVVAMARTGSGKTAAFLIPMFERLKTHLTSGVRALILAPTRELALQTLKFTKELGKFTGLKSAVILGGDRMDEQFSAIHENPDIIIATPGRFMHVLVEMEQKLNFVEYLVFDEADRLFEMGFAEHMREILQRVPENRQTVLFSATLPKLLVEFAKAGLSDPTLIRLDVDSKLSEHLKVTFLQSRSDDKLAILIYLLRNIIKPSEQTVIFVATKHHAEYLNLVLSETGFNCSYTYSSLDQTARKINVAKFRNKKTMILIVTDLAARGIDIPLLDNVINYNFPAKPKLFVHRVGRVARAGRSGTAYSLIAPDEVAYVVDLHLFLGRPLKPVTTTSKYTDQDDCLYGQVPQTVIDDVEENLRQLQQKQDIKALEKVTNNGYKHYIQTRQAASSESVKRIKELVNDKLIYHPMFGSVSKGMELERAKLLQSMRTFKAKGTIFEVNAKKQTDAYIVMKKKRQHHENVIQRNLQSKLDKVSADSAVEALPVPSGVCEASDETSIQEVFSKVVVSRPPNDSLIYDPERKKKRKNLMIKDEENYLHYQPKDFQSEKGLSLTSFDKEAGNATLDITGDEDSHIRQQRGHMTWDRKRKKYVSDKGFEPGRKKVKTESGQWISATYKTNIYKDWLDKSKITEQDDDDSENENDSKRSGSSKRRHHGNKMQVLGGKRKQRGFNKESKVPPAMQKKHRGGRRELQNKDQIIKQRQKKEKLQSFMKSREIKKTKHRPNK